MDPESATHVEDEVADGKQSGDRTSAFDPDDVVEVRVDDLVNLNLNGELHADGGSATNGSRPEAEPDTREVEVVVGEVEPPDAEVVEPSDDDEDEGDYLTPEDLGGSDIINYEDRLVQALPDLARLGALAATRGVTYGMRLGVRAGMRLARASVDPDSAVELARGVGGELQSYAREVLGITELEQRVDALTPVGDRFAGGSARSLGRGERAGDEERIAPEVALRAQGAELLRQSADVTVDDQLHPAFGRILGELAPDEGRILRLLSAEGPQPVVDIRTANLIGVGSQLIAQNLNMVDMQAGLRHADQLTAYLGNLLRLGLICFSDEPLEDSMPYQVLEAQPQVFETIKEASRAKSVQRSLRLTAFGKAFCDATLPHELDEVKALTSGDEPDQLTPSENAELGS